MHMPPDTLPVHTYIGRATTQLNGRPTAYIAFANSPSTDGPSTERTTSVPHVKKHGLVYFDQTPIPGRARGQECRFQRDRLPHRIVV